MPRHGRQLLTILVAHAGPQGARQGSGYIFNNLRKALGSGHEVRYPLMPRPDHPAVFLQVQLRWIGCCQLYRRPFRAAASFTAMCDRAVRKLAFRAVK